MSSVKVVISRVGVLAEESTHLTSNEPSAESASAWVDMTMKPRRREELSMVARMTEWDTTPYRENISTNSLLVTP